MFLIFKGTFVSILTIYGYLCTPTKPMPAFNARINSCIFGTFAIVVTRLLVINWAWIEPRFIYQPYPKLERSTMLCFFNGWLNQKKKTNQPLEDNMEPMGNDMPSWLSLEEDVVVTNFVGMHGNENADQWEEFVNNDMDHSPTSDEDLIHAKYSFDGRFVFSLFDKMVHFKE